jgi:dipeptidyl aminopeptidase/acylaminoacyl peptidase
MVAKLPRLIVGAGVLGALLVAAAAAPHPAHTHAALHAYRHVPATMALRRMPAVVAVVIRGDVYVIRADGSARRRLTGDRHATSPRLSPTQRQVAYVDTSRSHKSASPYPTTGDAWVVAVDSPRARRLTAAPVADLATPFWSPDGRRLAFFAGTAITVCVVATDRCTSVLRSSHGARWDSSAGIAWSPDGRRIAVALPYTGTYYPHMMRVAIGNVVSGRATTSTIRFPSGALGRAIPPGSYPSGDGLTWRPDGHGLVFATLGEGAGPPNVTGIWQVADSGGSAHLLIGTPAGVREKGYPAGSPLQQPTRFMFSPNGAYLATDPENRLWVAHADGTQGRFFDLHLARDCVLTQSTWLADSSGLAYVVLCLIPNRNAVTATLYSLTLTGAPPHLLAHLYSANSADQDDLQVAPSYRCVACGY